jgi:transposase
LLEIGTEIEKIAKVTGLSIEKIKKIKNQWDNGMRKLELKTNRTQKNSKITCYFFIFGIK